MFSKIFNNCVSEKRFYFLVLLGLLIWFMCKNADVAIMLFASTLFACSLSPLVNKLSKKMSRGMATTIVLMGVFIVLGIFIVPILYLSAYQIGAFAQEFPQYIDNLDDVIKTLPFMQNFKLSAIDTDAVMNALTNSSSGIINAITEFIMSISSAFIYIFTSVMFIFFFLADEQLVKNAMLKLFPSDIREKANKLLGNIAKKLGGYVTAQVIVSGSVWITMTVFLLLFKIKYALVLGLIAGVLSLIPVIGSAISLIICLIASYEAGIWTLVLITVLFTISHFIENHVVRPWIYSKFLNLHPILVFLALFVGAKYAGVIGVLFAPPFLMALCILLDELYTIKMDKIAAENIENK